MLPSVCECQSKGSMDSQTMQDTFALKCEVPSARLGSTRPDWPGSCRRAGCLTAPHDGPYRRGCSAPALPSAMQHGRHGSAGKAGYGERILCCVLRPRAIALACRRQSRRDIRCGAAVFRRVSGGLGCARGWDRGSRPDGSRHRPRGQGRRYSGCRRGCSRRGDGLEVQRSSRLDSRHDGRSRRGRRHGSTKR